MKIRQAMLMAIVTISSVLALTACGATDTVGKYAVKSFDEMTAVLDTKPEYVTDLSAWALTAPSGERFLISNDFTGQVDVRHELNLEPFISAGLDVSLLDETLYQVDEVNGKLLVVGDFGSEALGVDSTKTLKDAVDGIVKSYRDHIGYHSKLDHYGIAIGNGNMIEWASDMSKNDKDLVIVLNPEPLIAAGVDPSRLEGWVYAEIEVMDENGKPMLVYKFLKPFEIKN